MKPLEIAEKIECIRYLEYGMKIKMIETDFVGVGIDVPDDLEKARAILKNSWFDFLESRNSVKWANSYPFYFKKYIFDD